MGKPKGEGGRSKGRPSSSSLAASLLSPGASTLGFGGYVGSSRVESSSLGEEAGSSSSDMDGELAQHLKRLGRKDPITKVKALTTLSTLFKQASGPELALVIPKWAFEYKKLLYDYSRDVRRCTHEAMASLVAAVRRGLAPHLKSLMGPWWFSQFDPVPEVAQAARRSLEAAFPAQEKRLDALVLCATEIFLYLEENLRIKPQEMMEKLIPPDELEEMHIHVISSSLLAVATLIDVLKGTKLQTDGSDMTQEGSKAIVKASHSINSSAERIFSSHNYFLVFFKSKSPRVRSATYSILCSYVNHMHHAFNVENIKPLSAAILAVFGEKDPSCHSSMWDMVLSFSRKFPDSWFHVNVQKASLPHIWSFLQNGCYGSGQVSYPTLIIFLDSMPPKVVAGKSFLPKFYQNLWAGRNPHSLPSDQVIFFNAFKECFSWGLFNASRYFSGEDNILNFQVNLIVNILVGLLWHGYLLPGRKDQEEVLPVNSNLCARNLEDSGVNYPFSYFQELGKCIIVILSNISQRSSSLLQTFCTSFQKDCLYILQQEDYGEKYSERAERISNFLLLVDDLASQKNEAWPLNHIAGPLFSELFPLLRSLDSPDAVNILRAMIEIFGPRTLSEQFRSAPSGEGDDKRAMKVFLDIFKEDFVPLCLEKYTRSASSRLDLLISLLDEEIFSEQWSFIMVHAGKLQKDTGSDHVLMLARLMGKIRENIGNKMIGIKLQRIVVNSDCWQHDFLNCLALSIACRSSSLQKSDVSFLCAALGGSLEFDLTCFLSGETVVTVFEEMLKKLVGYLLTSPLNWAKSASSLLLAHNSGDLVRNTQIPQKTTLEMAHFAFDIISGSIYRLKGLDNEKFSLVASISAAIFIIEWEDNIVSEASIDDESDRSMYLTEVRDDDSGDSRWALRKKILDLHSRIGSFFSRSLSSGSRAKLADILVLTIKAVISEADILSVDSLTTFCCKWAVDMLKDICLDGVEEQQVLTKLLSDGESWTLRVNPCHDDAGRSATIRSENPDTIHESIQKKFSAFVSKLVLKLGVSKIIAGAEAPDEESASLSLPRPWLAAELLCSWEWQSGSAAESFLPLLKDLARTESSAEESIVCYVAKILIDGAISHAITCQQTYINAWILSDDDVENIPNPFLRALVALLLTLAVKDNTWAKREANLLLNYAVDRLYFGTEMDLSCLKVLPFIMNVVIHALDPLNEDRLQGYVSSWLEKALSLPPLALSQGAYNDSVEWVQMIISCYPLHITREKRNIQVKALHDVNHLEREFLLTLFRRQRFSLRDDSEAKAQRIMLANLTAVVVGHCWQEFDEPDWDYVFSQLEFWTRSTVLLMEETAEKVDAVVASAGPVGNIHTISRKLNKAMQIVVPSPINTTTIAIVIFSLVNRLQLDEHGQPREAFQLTRLKTWEFIKDGLFEHALRLFFSTGVTEAIARSFDMSASSIIASSRVVYSRFWELIGFCVVDSPCHVRVLAAQSMELWGLSKGPIAALYAILFSSKPLSSLQFAAFHILSSEPVCRSSVLKESYLLNGSQGENALDSSLDESSCLREEISCIIKNPANDVLRMDLTSQSRADIFLAWALLLSYLQSLPSSSALRERLVQCIQDSINPIILDLIFQQFPSKASLGSSHGQKKKDAELPVETRKAADAAKHAITTCSLSFAVETFWPISVESMAILSGSIFGLMIRLLPAYVRNWFTALRDRSLSQSIESFTKVWCSPPLFSEELSQIKGAAFGDDNFSVSVNKSALEIIATYKKEESGMDLVIRLPSCYPLKSVDVDCTRSLGVSEVKQRKWLLSLTAFVCNQNGAIAEAIRTWKSNLEREFEGVEECPICYSILHTTNHSLPRLACKTCKHKFHSACLYKWFSTSHKSTCPLCQTPF